MPAGRPLKSLEPYKESLIQLFRQGATYDDLRDWLKDEQGLCISVRGIKGWFKQWGIGRHLRTEVEEHVKKKIKLLFENDADDNEILENLKGEGYFLSRGTLVRLRFELGLKRRIRGPEAQAEADKLAYEAIKERLLGGLIDGYGRRMLYAHFKSANHVVQRDRLFRIYRTLNPGGVERCRKDIQRRGGLEKIKGKSLEGKDKKKLMDKCGLIEMYETQKRGIDQTSPQQERSPRRRCIPEEIWREENGEDDNLAAIASLSSLHETVEVENYEGGGTGAQPSDDAISYQPQSPSLTSSTFPTQEMATVLPTPYKLRSRKHKQVLCR